MIQDRSKKTLPTKHLSARVPWHDNKWNGTTCCNVIDNSFCRILPRIDSTKDPDNEPVNKKIDDSYQPPCMAEKGTFLSPHEYTREIPHSWADRNPLFKHLKPCLYLHKPFSFNAVPFLWMMKSKAKLSRDEERNGNYPHRSEKAETYELDYDVDLEEEVDKQLGFPGNIWVQHPQNQKVLLDAFFNCIQPQKSLVFYYCKHTPFTEPNQRVIIGVSRVRRVGALLHYGLPVGYKGHFSYPWDRCIEHTLTSKKPDGFLLPYHEVLELVEESDADVDLREFAAIAPDVKQFSFTAELVEHDTAIDSLLAMAESLKRAGTFLEKSFKDELDWIDNEISKIWNMRGAFPGMGSVLSALGIDQGNTIAWEIEKYIQNKDGDLLSTNPWDIFEGSLEHSNRFIPGPGSKLFTKTVQTKWKSKPVKKKDLLKLLSRCQLNNDQASLVIEEHGELIGTVEQILKNPYLLYERLRLQGDGLTFNQVDKLLLPPEKIRQAFPLPLETALEDHLDERRVRALAVAVMEEAAGSEGHSVLPFQELLERMQAKSLDQSLPIDEDILTAYAESGFFAQEILSIIPSGDPPTCFLKLQRLLELKTIIRQRINLKQILGKPYNIKNDWLALVNKHPKFTRLDPNDGEELLARQEKAEALKILVNYRFSVLIGPAGSGKTSLLEIFSQIPEIKKGGVLKLAPTGKARVKLGHDASTIAQFLFPDRYDGFTGNYFPNEDAGKWSGAKNVIVDEASMLTEEQLASLFDALGPVDRIVLVGDYRQLPPIGTGRPFVDITQELKPTTFVQKAIEINSKSIEATIHVGPAFAELTKIRRQLEEGDGKRWDVLLSKCFSDNPSKDDLEVFHALSSGEIAPKCLQLVKWYESTDFRERFREVLERELLDGGDPIKCFNRKIGARDFGDYQYFNCDYAEKEIEKWQVISPVNGYGFGVKEINKMVQTTYRKPYIDLAINRPPAGADYPPKRKIAKPKGSDNIVYGDKVINLRNTRWEDWQGIRPHSAKSTALNYIANGEIGVITGYFRGKNDLGKGEPSVEVAFSTQPGYSYVFWPNQLGEDGKYSLELAYAVTVHKAQGSGFKTVFFVLPSKGAILSRELIYTALTRQEDKIIILHQGDFRDFIRLASTEASATARRFTDLFHLPEVTQLNKKWYDARYVNISERGEPMLSKNEVIIANCLNKYKKRISYAYEDKLKLEAHGFSVKPDFTIDNFETGKRFYWEHLGMMTKTTYREKWEKKFKAYLDDGFVVHTKAKPSDERLLILTEENPNGGIDSQYIDRLVRTAILEEEI